MYKCFNAIKFKGKVIGFNDLITDNLYAEIPDRDKRWFTKVEEPKNKNVEYFLADNEMNCQYCGNDVGASRKFGEEGIAPPKPLDILICMYCAGVNLLTLVDEKITVIRASPEIVEDVDKKFPPEERMRAVNDLRKEKGLPPLA